MIHNTTSKQKSHTTCARPFKMGTGITLLCALISLLATTLYANPPLLTPQPINHWRVTNKICRPIQEQVGTWCQLSVQRQPFFNRLELEVIHLNKAHYQARLLIQPKGKQLKPSVVAAQQKATITINGGYYSPEFNPVGLFKVNNQRFSRYSSASKLLKAGITIDQQGQLNLVSYPNKQDLEKANSAMQVGPVLISDGKVDVWPNFAMSRRTVLAQTTHDNIIIIVTQSPVTLYQLASLLVKNPEFFDVKGIKSAVNLDGGGSSALTIKQKNTWMNIVELNPVRTLLLLYPAKKTNINKEKTHAS